MKQRLFSETIGISVIDEHTSAPLSFVKDIIIDTETGKILAFLLPKKKIIVPYDVIDWSDNITIQDENHILSIEEVIRVEKVWKERNRIFGKKVVTESGTYLGRAYDMSFDAAGAELIQIFVAKFFIIFRYDKRIIDRTSIIEIKKNVILVKDALERKQEKTPEMATLSPA